MTLTVEIKVAWRTYRNKEGKTHVPLDASWGTQGESSDLPVREMVSFLAGSNTPEEIIFQRFMPVKPSRIIFERLPIGLMNDWLGILDYYHGTEQLNVLAESLFGADSPKAKSWYNKIAEALLNESGACERMIRSAEY